jgi:SAM-dependent methyltransferase
MARRLGPSGSSTGVDISAPLLAAARARAAADGVANVAFVEADAQVHAFEPGAVDAVMSRFGVMFFDDPVAAFENLRRASRPGAKLAFACWRAPEENPFMTAAGRAAAPLLPGLKTHQAGVPGPFAFADRDRLRGILEKAGWSGVAIDPLDRPGVVSEADALTYATRVGPVGSALRSADEETRARVTAAVRGGLVPFVSDGAARSISACWLATAHSPRG